MEPAEPDQLRVLTFAVVLLLPALPVAWKAAGWRGDTRKKWSNRVEIAHAGLNERATSELVALQDRISEVLGGNPAFLPAEIWADPDPLVKRANRCVVLLRARDKVRGRFERYCRLASILIPTVAVYILGWVAATLYFTEVVHRNWLKLVGFAVGGLSIATALVIFALYAYFESKLTKAEEMAAGTRV
jgi:hypothetical protein